MKSKQIGEFLGLEYSFPEPFLFRATEPDVNHNMVKRDLIMATQSGHFGNTLSIDQISNEALFQGLSSRNTLTCGTLVVNSSLDYSAEEVEPYGSGSKHLIWFFPYPVIKTT